jgi:Uma2 family endonuclease
MREPNDKPMTVDEFMTWNDGTDTRYELDEGVPVAMSPPAGQHGTIVANATGICWSRLRDRAPCRPSNEAGIRVSATTRWQADVAVTCLPPAPHVEDPSLIVEVLSPTTRMHDLGRKLPDYQGLAAVREIWMIDSERRWIQHWRREAEHWVVQDFVGSSSFASEILDTEVPLDELYRHSGL